MAGERGERENMSCCLPTNDWRTERNRTATSSKLENGVGSSNFARISELLPG